jgi:two-component system, NtrC family, response regulator AlgB
MAAAIALARQVAVSDAPVLIIGEGGTGKRTLAAAIHRWSHRRTGPFLRVWCQALSPRPLDRGLLDDLRDACTGDATGLDGPAADGGTLFLDDISNGHLPIPFQVKLLRYLEDRCFGSPPDGVNEIDARVVAASTRDLDGEVRAGRIREDLFFRLGAVKVVLPPLRDRREDLPILRDHFLARLAARYGREDVGLTLEAERLLARYDWPGNVRELISVLEGALVCSRDARIGADDVSASLQVHAVDQVVHPRSLAEVEQQQIQLALRDSATLAEAAHRLGIDPVTLWRKRKRYGLNDAHGADRRRRSSTG